MKAKRITEGNIAKKRRQKWRVEESSKGGASFSNLLKVVVQATGTVSLSRHFHTSGFFDFSLTLRLMNVPK